MNRPIRVEALPGFRMFVTFPDGVAGEVDLSREVGVGVFAPLLDGDCFRRVYIGEFGQIAWSEDLEICSDAVYREIAGRSSQEPIHA